MENTKTKELLEFTEKYFLEKYPGNEFYIRRIKSNVKKQITDSIEGDLEEFIMTAIDKKWMQLSETKIIIDEKLTYIVELTERKFIKKYKEMNQYVAEIVSYVSNRCYLDYDTSKGDLDKFVVRQVENGWSELWHKIQREETDINGNKIYQIYISDSKGRGEISDNYNEEIFDEQLYDKPFKEGEFIKIGKAQEEISSEGYRVVIDEIESAFDDAFGETEDKQTYSRSPLVTDEEFDERKDEYLIAFFIFQATLDQLNDVDKRISKKYFDIVPSLLITEMQTKRMSNSELLINIDYYKFNTWVDGEDTRYFQELALKQMIQQVTQMDKSYEEYREIELKKNAKPRNIEEFPFVGAILVSVQGEVIAGSYKGCKCENYIGTISEHCEYLLFNKVLLPEDKEKAKGGTLFVTLEPCVSRMSGKPPCAIHCLESGINSIYIGTFDPDISVSWKGIDILRTGSYKFIKNEPFYNNIHGQELIRYFRKRGYKEEADSHTLTFYISEPVKVFSFYPDLTLEIIRLNEKFVKYHNKDLYFG